jgi:transcriptional regulator with PAS, ATPase and Fis domain
VKFIQAASPLILQALILSARWAGWIRSYHLQKLAHQDDQESEIQFLQDENYRFLIENEFLRKQVGKSNKKPCYNLRKRFQVIRYFEYFNIPRRQVTKRLGIARSTLYRWLKEIDTTIKKKRDAHNRTPEELARLVWEMAQENPH